MNVQVIFYNGLIDAQNKLRNHIDEINRINVFPVADGDTGTNLLISFEDNHLAFDDKNTINDQLRLFSEALFAKASGNSGFISSLLFTALANNMQNSNEFKPIDFAKALSLAVNQSITEIENYVDGSMLSFSEALACLIIQKGFKNWDKELYDFLDNSIQSVLKETSLKNPLLSSSGVIDAGSLGLSIWFMGLFSSLCGVEVSKNNTTPSRLVEDDVGCNEELKNKPPNYRYCVQATLGKMKIDEKTIVKLLRSSGDCSLNIVHDSVMRFHIHTDKPQALFSELMGYSTVKDVKIDDMKMQYHTANNSQTVAIVTDSSADIPEEIKEKYNIYVIPLSITQGSQKMLDGLTVSSDSLATLIENNIDYPKTSSPAPRNIDKIFNLLSHNYQHIIAITISSEMSATFSAFSKVAREYQNIHVIDSKRNSGAHGLVVREVAQLIEKGNSIEEIINMAERIISSKNIYVMVNKFSAMLKSGRVSKSKAWIANTINLKPVVGIDEAGKGVIISKAFSYQGQFNALISLLENHRRRSNIKGFTTLYVGDYEQAFRLNKKLTEILNVKSYGILHASPVISLHAGQGALAVAIDQEV